MTVKTAPAQPAIRQPAANFPHHNFPPRMPPDILRTAWVTVANTGTTVWPQGRVQLAIDLNDTRCVQLDLPHDVPPGEQATVFWTFRTPTETGAHRLKLEMVHPDGTSLAEAGARSVPLVISPEPAVRPTTRLWDRAVETNSYYWVPAEGGITWSSRGRGFPVFARDARGCRITDLEGREYLDCMMGWGCSLLGYANERIQRAVASSLSSGGVISLTHFLEMEVSELLGRAIPGAEMVIFGKNGSDVCTVAVRLARVHTGRPLVLCCGYHGWQDWNVERCGFAATGVLERGEPLVIPFAYSNLMHLEQLLEAHRGRVAAVLVEPCPVEGHNGPLHETVDPAFFQGLVELAHRHGALAIFDEIVSGFRYPGGSAQQAAGVIPDLTCLGKALGAGMPLSALGGRRDLFRASIGKTYYGPTFKGEVHSFAAARVALTIYREVDVPGHLVRFGGRLRETVNRLCRQLHIPGGLIGPMHRQVLAFQEANAQRLLLMRTLLNQELFNQGVLTYLNFIIPSLAHDDKALGDLCQAFEKALKVLAEAMDGDRFARYLEVPPIPG
jgi:glutamate-1-semialdehyde aminotransferase